MERISSMPAFESHKTFLNSHPPAALMFRHRVVLWRDILLGSQESLFLKGVILVYLLNI